MKNLYTIQGEALINSDELPWQEYPRPRMVRDSFIPLNGWWDFAITSDNRPPVRFEREIRVPFVPESLLSGIHEAVPDGSYLWYHRWIDVPEQGRALLHFGAVDQETVVWVNGKRAPLVEGMSSNGYTHEGGYEPFTVEISSLVKHGRAELLIQVFDQLKGYQMPYGKQSLDRGGMWYTPCSGIWQSVWMEIVPETYIQNVRVETAPVNRNDICGAWTAVVKAEGVTEGTVEWEGSTVALREGKALLPIGKPRLWSPETPELYRFTLTAGEDRVQSYFALRFLSIDKVGGIPRLLLNGKPYFFHGLLDQGYWSDGLYTAASPDCIREELAKIKELGFNMLRKHIKVEPEIYYYECDRQGIALIQDMVQNGEYTFFQETALPTVGLLSRKDNKRNSDPKTRENFIEGMLATVRQLKEHPSIVCWTIFNEGWGQFSGTELYMQLRREDPTRWIDTASGWFHYKGLKTDVESRHVYFSALKAVRSDRPYILSEFGGFAYPPDGHRFNEEKVYGYKKFVEREICAQAIYELYRDRVLPLVKKGLCASIYTQVSDVEDETNGLFSYDRRVQKVFPEELAGIAKALRDAIEA